MFSIFASGGLSAEDAARLRRMERKLDLILGHLGIDEAELFGALPEEVRRLADSGRKIEAIKAHREAFGSNLVEARQAVEDYLRNR